MKRFNSLTAALATSRLKAPLALSLAAVAALAFGTAGASAEPMCAQGEYDVGELMVRAGATWDLDRLDAVVLLERSSVTVAEDGALTTRTHRIVWMSTEYGLELYGDLRVPWNSATSRLEVLALRTWREGRWWPHETEISETAVVATIPSAVRTADDYTTIRETMLLHDGIELPCIVETVYEITEGPRGDLGRDGAWVFTRYDPCVVSRFDLIVPPGLEVATRAMNGAPDASTVRTTEHGVGHTWTMETLERFPRPLVEEPTSESPYVVWSSWGDWRALGEAVVAAIDDEAHISEALVDSVAELARDEPDAWSRAEAVAGFVAETTRAVSYPESFWAFAARPAVRTWETAYGHRLDRAALAAALFREAGCGATPIYAGAGPGERVPDSVPSLARFGGLLLRVEAPGLSAVYDPSTSRLSHGAVELAGRTVWRVSGPNWTPVAPLARDASALRVSLSMAPTDEGWSGTGHVSGTRALSPYADMVGLEGESSSYLGTLAGSLLGGANVTDWSVVEFGENGVVCGFTFDLEAGEDDDLGRTRLELGSPSAGLLGALPSDVHLYTGQRTSPILLDAPLVQTVTLVLDPGDHEIVASPEASSIANGVGSFELSTEEREDGRVEITRTLSLDRARIEAAEWSELRALLLAETHERNGTFLLE